VERIRACGDLHVLRSARILLGAALVLAAAAPWRGVAEVRPQLPAGALAVPLFRQATPYSCGASVLQAVLTYWGVYDGGEVRLHRAMETTEKDGTEPPAIARVARQHGLEARLAVRQRLADLREALKRGDTVVLNVQAWRDARTARAWEHTWDDGHYVVLVAMDAGFAYVMDPSTSAAYTYVPLVELLARWHDFEDRHGYRQEYHQCAIYIRGKKAATRFPQGLVRLE
jgi:predicted double-glycine peptidase